MFGESITAKELDTRLRYYVISENDTLYQIKFKTGLNTSIYPLSTEENGGIFFWSEALIVSRLKESKNNKLIVRDMVFTGDEEIMGNTARYVTNRVVLGERRYLNEENISDFVAFNDEYVCKKMIYANRFQDIPDEYKTQRVCDIAIDHDSDNIQDIPEHFITPKMCMDVLEFAADNINYLPKHLIYKLYKDMIKVNVKVLKYLPKELLTLETLSISNKSFVLSQYPKHLITYDICMDYVKRDGNALQYVPTHLIDQKLCDEAFNQTIESFHFIPYEFKTPEMCKLAIHPNTDNSLLGMPMEYVTEEMCLTAVTNKHSEMNLVPQHFITPSFCVAAVNANPTTFSYVPVNMLTFDMCKIALASYGYYLQNVPEHLINEELCTIAVNNCGRSLEHVPLQYRTIQLYISAIKNSSHAIHHIPKNIIIESLELLANIQS
jgi:hypothetical protein